MLTKRLLFLGLNRSIRLRLSRRALANALAQQMSRFSLTTSSSFATAEHVTAETFELSTSLSHDDIEIPNHIVWEVAEQQVVKTIFVCEVTHEKVTFRELLTRA